MGSSCTTIQAFIESRGLPWNGNTAKKTTGWSKEKKLRGQKFTNKVHAKLEHKIELETEKLSSKIVQALKQHNDIAELCLDRINAILIKNRKIVLVTNKRKITGPLQPSEIQHLANAAKTASDMQRIAMGLKGNDPGKVPEGDRESIQTGILDRVRQLKPDGAAGDDKSPGEGGS